MWGAERSHYSGAIIAELRHGEPHRAKREGVSSLYPDLDLVGKTSFQRLEELRCAFTCPMLACICSLQKAHVTARNILYEMLVHKLKPEHVKIRIDEHEASRYCVSLVVQC